MDTQKLTSVQAAKALFNKAQEISAKNQAREKAFNLEVTGQSAGFAMRRFSSKPPVAILAAFNSSLNLTIFVAGAEISRQNIETATALIKFSIEAAHNKNTAPISAVGNPNGVLPLENVCLAPAFASAQMMEAVDFQAQMQHFHVDRIAANTFIGPLRQETMALKSAFEAQKITPAEFTRDALAVQGIAYSRAGEVWISSEIDKNLRSAFAHNVQEKLTPISTFTRATGFGRFTAETTPQPAANSFNAPVPKAT